MVFKTYHQNDPVKESSRLWCLFFICVFMFLTSTNHSEKDVADSLLTPSFCSIFFDEFFDIIFYECIGMVSVAASLQCENEFGT